MLNTLNVTASARRFPVATARRHPHAEQWTLAVLVDILRRRLKLLIALALIVVALAVLYLFVAPERFTATTVLIPDTRRTPPSPTEVSQDAVLDPAIVESQIETMKSEKIALAVIDKLRLWEDPEFVGDGPSLMSRVLKAIMPGGGGGPPRDLQDIKRRAAVGSFSRMLKVLRVGRSYVTEVSFTSLDPDKAANIANEIADAYIQDQLGAKLAGAERAGRWMQQRIVELRQQTSDAAKALDAFKSANNIQLDANGRTPGEREEEELGAALDRAKQEATQARVQYERVQAVLRGEDGRESLPDSGFIDTASEPALVRLRDEYRQMARQLPGRSIDEREPLQINGAQGERFAELRNAIWDEIHKLAAVRKTDHESAMLRETTLTRRIAAYAPQAEANRRQRDQLRKLEQEHQNFSQLHDVLQTRFARVSQFVQQQSLPVSEARIVTAATPPLRPSSPKTALVLLLAVFAGGTVGVGGALGREYFDRTVRRPQQVERDLGLRWLGSLPRFSRGMLPAGRGGKSAASNGRAKSLLASKAGNLLSGQPGETLRSVKLAIDDGIPPQHGRVVGVVSACSGAGKSTIAFAAAMLLGQAGKRTLLIDGDLRDPGLTRALVPGLAGGLASIILDQQPPSSHIVQTGLGFHLLGQAPGFTAMHPSDLLGSREMLDLLDFLRKSYDYIVIDTPALLDHIDVAASAAVFDGFVMVAEWGRTTVEEVEDALAISHAITERVVGIVLNKARSASAG